MGLIKNWIKIKIFNLMVWAAVNLLGAKVNMDKIKNEYQQAPEYQIPCEMCHDYVVMAGRPVHVSQLRVIEDEWVNRGIIG